MSIGRAVAGALLLLSACNEPAPPPASLPECPSLAAHPALARPARQTPQAVVAAIGVDPERSRWERIEQPFWKLYDVYSIGHGIQPTPVMAAAADPWGNVVRLTNDRPIRKLNVALACFNQISRWEGVAVDDENVTEYLGFFLRTYLAPRGQFLRDRGDAERAAAAPWRSREADTLRRRIDWLTDPRFEIEAFPYHFEATTYHWHPELGIVYEYFLTVSEGGTVGFDYHAFGTQPYGARPLSVASCFAVHPDGLVLTAYHVIDSGNSITVRFENGAQFSGVVEREEPDLDLATVRIDGPAPGYVTLFDGDDPEIGEPVFTFGFPGTPSLWSKARYEDGYIVAPTRRWGGADAFEVSFRIEEGASGSPLANHRGEAVGVLVGTRSLGGTTVAVEARHAVALLPSPPALPPAANPDAAIGRVRRAVCEIEIGVAD